MIFRFRRAAFSPVAPARFVIPCLVLVHHAVGFRDRLVQTAIPAAYSVSDGDAAAVFGQLLLDLLFKNGDLRLIVVEEQYRKLVPADPVSGHSAAHEGMQALTDLFQSLVACLMPEGVVQLLEAVHIERRNGLDVFAESGAVVIERLSVEQSCQRIQPVVVRVKHKIEEYAADNYRGGQIRPAVEHALDGRRNAEEDADGNDDPFRAAFLHEAAERNDQKYQYIKERNDERDESERPAVKAVILSESERNIGEKRRAVDEEHDSAGDPPKDGSVFCGMTTRNRPRAAVERNV